MAWWEYAIPGYNVYAGARDLAGGTDNLKSALFGSTFDPNASKIQDADYIRSQIKAGIGATGSRPAPQMAGAQIAPVTQMGGVERINPSAYAAPPEFRQGQSRLAGTLERVAGGQQAGAGELAVQRQAQRAIGNALGASTMARGGSAVNAARAGARAASGIGLSAAGAGQRAAMEDQASARQQLAGVFGQGRAQDLEAGGQNLQASMANAQAANAAQAANVSAQNQRIFQQAGLDQATSVANMQARLQAIGMSDQAIQQYLQQLFQLSGAEMAARVGDKGLLPGLMQAGGTALAAL